MNFKEKIKKMKEKRKLKQLDYMYDMYGFGGLLFPPSMYLTHTKEEMEEITKKEIEDIREVIKNISKRESEDSHL